jgi:hypothetical protein
MWGGVGECRRKLRTSSFGKEIEQLGCARDPSSRSPERARLNAVPNEKIRASSEQKGAIL